LSGEERTKSDATQSKVSDDVKKIYTTAEIFTCETINRSKCREKSVFQVSAPKQKIRVTRATQCKMQIILITFKQQQTFEKNAS